MVLEKYEREYVRGLEIANKIYKLCSSNLVLDDLLKETANIIDSDAKCIDAVTILVGNELGDLEVKAISGSAYRELKPETVQRRVKKGTGITGYVFATGKGPYFHNVRDFVDESGKKPYIPFAKGIVDEWAKRMVTDKDDGSREIFGVLDIETRTSMSSELMEGLGIIHSALEHVVNQRYFDTIDHLMNIYRYRYLFKVLKQEVSKSIDKKHPLSVILLDVDDLKKYNDSFGHESGDYVLRMLGKIISSNLRNGDSAGRKGGDEIIIVLPDTNSENAVVIAERLKSMYKSGLREYVNELNSPEQKIIGMGSEGLSIGISEFFPREIMQKLPDIEIAKTAYNLIKEADTSMYSIKHKTKDGISVFLRKKK